MLKAVHTSSGDMPSSSSNHWNISLPLIPALGKLIWSAVSGVVGQSTLPALKFNDTSLLALSRAAIPAICQKSALEMPYREKVEQNKTIKNLI